jgi:hypothetical protein
MGQRSTPQIRKNSSASLSHARRRNHPIQNEKQPHKRHNLPLKEKKRTQNYNPPHNITPCRHLESHFLHIPRYIVQALGPKFSPTPRAIGSRRLSISTEVLMRTPRLHQPHVVWEPSSHDMNLLPDSLASGMAAYFRDGLRA